MKNKFNKLGAIGIVGAAIAAGPVAGCESNDPDSSERAIAGFENELGECKTENHSLETALFVNAQMACTDWRTAFENQLKLYQASEAHNNLDCEHYIDLVNIQRNLKV